MHRHYLHPIVKLATLAVFSLLPLFVSAQATIKEFTGINVRRSNPVDRMKVAGFVREYHEWALDEGYPGLNGVFETASPGYPNNLYKWNPSYQTQSQGLHFDEYYQELDDAGLVVEVVLMQSAPYIINPDLIPAFPGASDQLEQKPLFAGEDALDPASYLEHGDWLYQLAARFGSTVYSTERKNQLITPKLADNETVVTGLGYVSYMENWNETNKWWLLPTYPSAYFTSEEYAAMTSTDFDGHMETLSLITDPDDPNVQISTVGVKNADPNMKFVLSGISDVDLTYLEDMVAWWTANRSANSTFGQYPFDVINFHHYSNINQNLHGFGVGGISPEEDDFKGDLAAIAAYRDQHFPDKELWLSEFGYDTDDVSEMRVPFNGIGNADRQEIQGQWIVRSFLEIAASGFDKAVMYELKDACTGSLCGLYQSSGLLQSDAKGLQPKKSWYYMGTYYNVLSDMAFDADLSPCQDTVCNVDCPRVYRFSNPNNANEQVYAIWSPTSCDKASFNYVLDLEGATDSYLIQMESGSLTGNVSYLTGNSVNVDVTERPVFISVGKTYNTDPVDCVNGLVLENATCNSARISWQSPAGVDKVQIWRLDGSVDLSVSPFNMLEATFVGDDILGASGEYYITGLEQDSTYTIVLIAENSFGRISDPCTIEVTTNSNNCKIAIDPAWIFTSSNPANPPVELFDEQGIDPICDIPSSPTSAWGIDLTSQIPVSVSIDLQQQYYIDAIYYHDGVNIGDFIIEYADSPNGPWEVLATELTVPFEQWKTLSNLVSSTTPVRFMRFTGDAEDLAVIGEVVICGIDSGLGGGSIPPGPVTDLQSVFPSCNSLTISWLAPLDNDLDHYEISYPGGQVEVVPAVGVTFTHTVFGLNAETAYDVLVSVVDLDGLYSTVQSINSATLPLSDCIDDCGNTCDCQICLKESWIFDLTNVNGIDPKNLVDEQMGADAFCGNGGSLPDSEWGEYYGSNNNVPPMSAMLDLQQCHLINSVSFFDGFGTGTGQVEYQDEVGNWVLIATFTTDLTNEWHEIAGLSIQARYLRFTKNENQAKINEIAICGFPLNCETCTPPANDSDGDGVADACDICPGFDDFEDGDMDGIPNGCDTACPNTGQPCDDGIACTEGDVVDNDCNCIGTFADDDGDGVCNAEDACPGFDDNIDNNNDGIPDACESSCNYLTISYLYDNVSCNGSGDGGITLDVPCSTTGGASSNLALNKTATQSSTSAAPASKAVDGNTGGNFWLDNSTSATGWENQPWWELDLGEVSAISDIEIWGRTDCCELFLNNYYVLVSETPFQSNDLNTLLNTVGVQSFYQDIPAGTPSLVNINVNGRYVRIQLSGASLLYITEVVVLGQGGGSCNFQYSWTNGIGDIPNPSGLAAGTYEVTVTNLTDGCSSNTVVQIDQPTALVCTISESQSISSYGNNDGALTASANGGTAPFSYLWSNGQTNAIATNLIAGNYTVTVTDANACNTESSFLLENPPANCTQGDPCNDNNPCTVNDLFDASCNCAGTFADDDGDGVCNNDDTCPGFDDNLDDDGDGIPNDCDPESGCAGFSVTLSMTDESCFNANDGAVDLTPPCTSNGGGSSGINLALNQPTTQSSTNWNADASRAVDGNADGNFWTSNSVTGTAWENNAWWEVDLGAVKSIGEIEVWNRTDCCSSFLSNYYVLISENPFVAGTLNDVLAQPGVLAFHQNETAGSPTVVNASTSGRFVRVQLAGATFLSLAEVIVKEGGQPDPDCQLEYLWSNGATSQNINALSPGTYNVTMTNQADGCMAIGTANIQEAPAFTCDLQVLQTVSTSGGNDGSLEISSVGGIGQHEILWSNGQSSALISNLVAGTYSVTVSDESACTCSASVFLEDPGTPSSGYCGSQGQAPWVEYIHRVQFAGIDNESFKELYGDFTDQSGAVQLAGSYDIELTPGFSWLSYDEHWAVWIDFDQNGSFDDPGELVISQNSNDPVIASITIPNNAFTGVTRMRVAMQRDAAPTPCATFQLGEVEDYSLSIISNAINLAAQDKIEFEAWPIGREVRLVWLTNMDDISENYIVEHSTDGEHFEMIMSQLPLTSENGNEIYELMHLPTEPGIQYYRLRQIKKQGNDYLSEVKQVEFLIDLFAFTVFPNPANKLLFISGSFFNGNPGKVQLSNITGSVLIGKEYSNLPNEPFAVDVRDLKDGMYFVRVKADGFKQQVARVVVSR